MDFRNKIDQELVLKVNMNNKSIKQQEQLYNMILKFTDKINKIYPDASIVIGSNYVQSTGICLQDREKY